MMSERWERKRRCSSQSSLASENSASKKSNGGGTPPTTFSEPPSTGSSPSLSRKQLKPAGIIRNNSALRHILATTRIKAAIDAAKSSENQFALDDLRIGLKKYMSNSFTGKLYENFIIFIGFFAAVEYIHSTYALNKHNAYQNQRPILDSLDIGFAIIFAFDWLLNGFLADSKVYYFWR